MRRQFLLMLLARHKCTTQKEKIFHKTSAPLSSVSIALEPLGRIGIVALLSFLSAGRRNAKKLFRTFFPFFPTCTCACWNFCRLLHLIPSLCTFHDSYLTTALQILFHSSKTMTTEWTLMYNLFAWQLQRNHCFFYHEQPSWKISFTFAVFWQLSRNSYLSLTGWREPSKLLPKSHGIFGINRTLRVEWRS